MSRRAPRFAITLALLGACGVAALAAAGVHLWRRTLSAASSSLARSLEVTRGREQARCWASPPDATTSCRMIDVVAELHRPRGVRTDHAIAEQALACACTANLDESAVSYLASRDSDYGPHEQRARWHDAQLRIVRTLASTDDEGWVVPAADQYVRFVHHEAPEHRARAAATLESVAAIERPLAPRLVPTILRRAQERASHASTAQQLSPALPEALLAGLRAARVSRLDSVLDRCDPRGWGCAHALHAAGLLDAADLVAALTERKRTDVHLRALAAMIRLLPPPEPVDASTAHTFGPRRGLTPRRPRSARGARG
jgi:hypothetical protein